MLSSAGVGDFDRWQSWVGHGPIIVHMNSLGNAPSFEVSKGALAALLESRAEEVDAASLALWLEVSGANGSKFSYDMYFQPAAEASSNDHVIGLDGLNLVIPFASAAKLNGARLDVASDGSGMTITNPNEPKTPDFAKLAVADLSGDVAQRVMMVLEQQINPSIASHGGFAELIAVEADAAYVKMGGGCQGCGMAKVTMSEGITTAIKAAVPEITRVVDVTDHASGTNPYYEAAKK